MLISNVSKKHVTEFVLHEASGQRSRDNIVVTQSGTEVLSGTVLALIDTGTAAFAMDAGATGNPTSGAIVVGIAAKPGIYAVRFNAPTKFSVEDPEGVTIGNGTTGVAFNKAGMSFTLTAGGTAAVDGDTAKFTVSTGTGKYVPYTANGAAGEATAICYNYLPAKTGDTKAVGFTSACEVNRYALTGLDTLAEAQLRKAGIKVRGQAGLPNISTPAL